LQEIEALLAESDNFKRFGKEEIGPRIQNSLFNGRIMIATDSNDLYVLSAGA
jgi:hypothetical protein